MALTASHVKVEVYLYVAGLILAIIFVSLLIALALISLLCDLNVIKSEKAGKWLNIIKLVVAALALVAFVLVLASVLKMVKNSPLTVGYAVITNVVLAALTVAVLAVALIPFKKKV